MPELAGIGRERFARASVAGRWRTAVDIGTRVFKGFAIGHVGGVAVVAPIDGVLRGIARDGVEVPAALRWSRWIRAGEPANGPAWKKARAASPRQPSRPCKTLRPSNARSPAFRRVCSPIDCISGVCL